MKTAAIALSVLVSAALLAPDAGAQGFPRRDRSGSPRDRSERPQAAAATPDPFAAIEHELPSLNVDLMLKADQVEAWNRFERDVREAAELDRARRRHLLALRDASAEPTTALKLMGNLAEEDRQKADATADVKRDLEALYARLDDGQKRTLDRRVVQSQALGPGP
jgi:hypothetical protein